jgi:hypothetical protein
MVAPFVSLCHIQTRGSEYAMNLAVDSGPMLRLRDLGERFRNLREGALVRQADALVLHREPHGTRTVRT